MTSVSLLSLTLSEAISVPRHFSERNGNNPSETRWSSAVFLWWKEHNQLRERSNVRRRATCQVFYTFQLFLYLWYIFSPSCSTAVTELNSGLSRTYTCESSQFSLSMSIFSDPWITKGKPRGNIRCYIFRWHRYNFNHRLLRCTGLNYCLISEKWIPSSNAGWVVM
jgi:hypothetical protein